MRKRLQTDPRGQIRSSSSGVMTLTVICFLILLTGGNASSSESQELQDDQQRSNQSFAEKTDGNTTSYELSDAFNQTSNQSSVQNSDNCSYEAVLNHLNLTRNNDRYIMTRPVKDYRTKTEIKLEMVVYAILDVRESDQTFISYIWIHMLWSNEFMKWNSTEFCGISYIEIPAEAVWKPDLTIEEMTEKDKAPPTPYVCIFDNGQVELRNDQVVVSTCKMYIYKFPFDIQSCNITFKSILYPDEELNITFNNNNTAITDWSRRAMDSQYEWLFLNMTVTNDTVNYFGYNQTTIVYTIEMKRRSVLYVANFLLPVLFFLCLDFASLLLSDSGGEKIGFKVTVLLAVTVMQLILNDILPSSSNNVPIIVIYCAGVFLLMLVSLLEAILVKYLMEKDSALDSETTTDPDRQKCIHCASRDEMDDQTPSIYKESSSNQLNEIFLTVEKVSGEMKEMRKAMKLLRNKEEEVKSGYWTNMAKKINKIFTILYVTGVTVFLCTIFFLWI